MSKIVLNTLQKFNCRNVNGKIYSLNKLGKILGVNIKFLPVSIRIILESMLRNFDNFKIRIEHIERLANWKPNELRNFEIPFIVSRVILQDFTGVPLLADIAAIRSAIKRLDKNPEIVEPLVPVDLVIDHSVQVDYSDSKNALELNMKLELERNIERYKFIKWGVDAFKTFNVVSPGNGIIHQINLEYLSKGVHCLNNNNEYIYYPDTLVGTDSHTTMINSIGTVGWGVGGIEAESSMLGQPISFLTPDVVCVNLINKLSNDVTATDLALTITKLLRKRNVVGKFVEFCGDGARSLSIQDRATISNMAPEYGATIGFFAVDEKTIKYFRDTGRNDHDIEIFEYYFRKQELFGINDACDLNYTSIITLDLNTVVPSLSGPKRPQDLVSLNNVNKKFVNFISKYTNNNKLFKNNNFCLNNDLFLKHGDIVIAAITSCTNTSNPELLIYAGLLAKNAVKHGLLVPKYVKTSFTPGSRVVSVYLKSIGLLKYFEKLGFYISAYGCATCIGNSGNLNDGVNDLIVNNNIIVSSILSGNRNFEARIHPNVKSNFLGSPVLVVAYAISGNIMCNLLTEPLGISKSGKKIYLRDIWPKKKDVLKYINYITSLKLFNNKNYFFSKNNIWNEINFEKNKVYSWPKSTYISEPPFLKIFNKIYNIKPIFKANILGIFGDFITTDHISPAGHINKNSPAGIWLIRNGVKECDFNSYGSRRGNHNVMVRGTFSNPRIKNLMVKDENSGLQIEGGFTIHYPSCNKLTIYDAAMKYIKSKVSTVIFAGKEYGTGSSRDWAAKGTKLLGVKAIIAESFERIHRSNLIGMGILPLQFQDLDNVKSLNIVGNETCDIEGLNDSLKPCQNIKLIINYINGFKKDINVIVRIDTMVEMNYYKSGGILPYIFNILIK